jgi:hypothetical protein
VTGRAANIVAFALALALASPTGVARAQSPAQPPPGWFCVASPAKPSVDACFRDRAACEQHRDALSATVPDVAGCTPPAAPAAPAAPEEDLLANLNKEEGGAKKSEADTYGVQLKIFGVETTLGGYGDSTFTITPEARTAEFDAHAFNPVISARMTETLSGEMELEVEHGAEVEIEYAMVDWTPFKTRALVVRTGKFQIPIGKFNEQYHPSFRYQQVGRPRMFQDVVPVGWSDVGIQLRGLLGARLSFEYQTWAVNGLAREEAESVVSDEFVRGLRAEIGDNNFDKAIGARIGVNYGKRSDPVRGSIAISGQSGKIDASGAERLSTADVDAHLGIGPLTLHAEAAQTFLGRKGHYGDTFERGAYLQLTYTAGRWTPAVRWEYATQISVDETDGAADAETKHQSVAPSISFAPSKHWSVRLELLAPYRPEGELDNTSLTAMIAFVF